jgi:hypothetical protein
MNTRQLKELGIWDCLLRQRMSLAYDAQNPFIGLKFFIWGVIWILHTAITANHIT